MSRRLVFVNVVFAAVSILCIVVIVKQLATARPAPSRGRAPAGAPGDPAAASDSKLPAQAYNVIASRNLFSPTRSESAGPSTAAGSTPVMVVKPALHGVVLREGSPIAYLEDPLTKRIAGYRVEIGRAHV